MGDRNRLRNMKQRMPNFRPAMLENKIRFYDELFTYKGVPAMKMRRCAEANVKDIETIVFKPKEGFCGDVLVEMELMGQRYETFPYTFNVSVCGAEPESDFLAGLRACELINGEKRSAKADLSDEEILKLTMKEEE